MYSINYVFNENDKTQEKKNKSKIASLTYS